MKKSDTQGVNVYKRITWALVTFSLACIITTSTIYRLDKPMAAMLSNQEPYSVTEHQNNDQQLPQNDIYETDAMFESRSIEEKERGLNSEIPRESDREDEDINVVEKENQQRRFTHLFSEDQTRNRSSHESPIVSSDSADEVIPVLGGDRSNDVRVESSEESINNKPADQLRETTTENIRDISNNRKETTPLQLLEESSEDFSETNVSRLELPNKFNSGLSSLSRIFQEKLKFIQAKKFKLLYDKRCDNKNSVANSCDDSGCLQMRLPDSPERRLEQIMQRPNLQLSDTQHAILQQMASKVKGHYDVIIMTAASSNHFLESQALLQNLHDNVFPALKNFTLLYYDLGLTEGEREQVKQFCNCQVLSFPFSSFPTFVSTLKCYSWKPVMIKAHLRQAQVVLWMDASIRFPNSSSIIHTLIKNVKARSVQIGGAKADSTFRTYRSMYHFFGDEPCAYLGMGQAKATIGGYHNEPFVDRAVLEPWVACALQQLCMCPPGHKSAGCRDSKTMARAYGMGNGPIVYGLCHRFDQSAISLILHKLYRSQYGWVYFPTNQYVKIARDNQINYFDMLKTDRDDS